MNELIVRWGYIPPEIRAPVREVLVRYLWLVPRWCRVVTVRYGGEHVKGPGVQASCDAVHEYRFAGIVIHAGWLDSNVTERRLSIIHELLHIPTMPMVAEHKDVVERMFSDGEAPKFKGKLEDTWRQAFESSVQDLAYSVLGLPMATLPATLFFEEEDEAGA